MSHITRIVIALNADGSHKGSAVYDAETIGGKVFDLEPRAITAADSAALAAVLDTAHTAALAAVDANTAAIETLTSERDAAQARVAELEAQIAAAQAVAVSAVPMSSARIALSRVGKLQAVQAAINAIEGQPGDEARQWWEYSSEIRRNHPLVAALTSLIGTTEDVDALFALARQIADGNA